MGGAQAVTASWIACVVLMPVVAAISMAAGWAIRKSRTYLTEVRCWEAGWEMGWEAARQAYEKREEETGDG